MNRRWLALVVVVLLVILIGPIVMVMTQGVGEPAALQPSEPAQPSPSTQASAAADPTGADGLGVADLDQSVWWRTGWRPADDPNLPDWSRLTVGLLDGTILGHTPLDGTGTMPGEGAPFVRGPLGGRIVYATQVAGMHELHVIDTRGAGNRVVASARATIHDAVPMDDGTIVFVASQGMAGIWRVPADGSAEPEMVAAPAGLGVPGVDALLTAPINDLPPQITIAVDAEQERVAMLACTPQCVLRVFGLADGRELSSVDRDPSPRVVSDLIGDVAVLEGVVAVDVVTGAILPGLPPGVAVAPWDRDMGVELPEDWTLSTEPIAPEVGVIGARRFVAIGPNGEVVRLDVLGDAVING